MHSSIRLSVAVMFFVLLTIAMMECSYANPNPEQHEGGNVADAIRFLQDLERIARPRCVENISIFKINQTVGIFFSSFLCEISFYHHFECFNLHLHIFFIFIFFFADENFSTWKNSPLLTFARARIRKSPRIKSKNANYSQEISLCAS